jgi:uncharacterized membrane protein
MYRPILEVNAFHFIAQSLPHQSVVLAAYDTSNALPAWAPVHTLIGHGPESLNLKEIQPRAECFYRSTCTDAERKGLLSQFGVAYVFWGPIERALGNEDLASLPYLEPVYQKDGYIIFKVMENVLH